MKDELQPTNSDLIDSVINRIDEKSWSSLEESDQISMLQTVSPLAIAKGITVQNISDYFSGELMANDEVKTHDIVVASRLSDTADELIKHIISDGYFFAKRGANMLIVNNAGSITLIGHIKRSKDLNHKLVNINVVQDDDGNQAMALRADMVRKPGIKVEHLIFEHGVDDTLVEDQEEEDAMSEDYEFEIEDSE
jgi:hypothetical protein